MKRSTKKWQKQIGNGGEARGSSSSRYSCKQHFALNFFECWDVHQQPANLHFKWTLCAQVLLFQQLQESHLWVQRSLTLLGVLLWRISRWHYSSAFFRGRMRLLSRPDGFMLFGKMAVYFFSTSELLYPNQKIRLRLIRARPTVYLISDNPNVSLGIVDCSLYTRRFDLRVDYHKNRMIMLAYTPVVYNYLETLLSSFLRDNTSSTKEVFLTLLQFVELQLEW